MRKKEEIHNSLILLNCVFFTSYIQLFLRHVSENTAPLHPNRPKPFIDKVISRVQVWVQEGARGCKCGAQKEILKSCTLAKNKASKRFTSLGCKVQPKTRGQVEFPRVSSPFKWKKNTLFIYTFLSLKKWLEGCYYSSSDHPAEGLCQPVLVTWLTGQTKGRNGGGGLTAHNYKLCGMDIVQIHSIRGSQGPVSWNSAVRTETPQFQDGDRAWKHPPPHEKLTTSQPPRPPYGFINYSEFSNSFLFLVLCLQLLFLGARGGIA
jgi:hypothetical protein